MPLLSTSARRQNTRDVYRGGNFLGSDGGLPCRTYRSTPEISTICESHEYPPSPSKLKGARRAVNWLKSALRIKRCSESDMGSKSGYGPSCSLFHQDEGGRLEAELEYLRNRLKDKEDEVVSLLREIHKLKSVLQATTSSSKNGHPDILSTLHEQHSMAGQSALNKKQGVSGESAHCRIQRDNFAHIQTYEKDSRAKELIEFSIMENDFLKNLSPSQVRQIVDAMYPQEFLEDALLIKEGDAGCHLYVLAEGELEVLKECKVLGRMGPGKAFGELAILYNCTRTATVRAVTDAKLWVLDRSSFQAIMMRDGMQKQEENMNFLKSVPLLQNLSNALLSKMADVLEMDSYSAGEYIIREGMAGDTFYIISYGQVKVTKKISKNRGEELIRVLGKGDYFGEQALLREDKRTANVIALENGVQCLALDRESFNQLIGDLQELQDKHYDDFLKLQRLTTGSPQKCRVEEEYVNINLEDLTILATLGVGGFGRVELVQYIYDKSRIFALKCLQKRHIVETRQQEHALCERDIMMTCRSPFICRMHKTFKDQKYVYMLLDAYLGGEVWTMLRDKGYFDDQTTRFYTACVVEAIDYLHSRNVIYRDLKPENLVLDSTGYIKLVDFGFAKIVVNGCKTWTFCGTPEYVAPEIILNRGHDRAVDFWSIGIMMFELFTGMPPFTAGDPMRTYNIILKGIDMIDFPPKISKPAASIIKRLCRENPSERIGYQKGGIVDIKKHKWFQGFDWDGLRARTLAAPFIPKIKNPTDVDNFDVHPRSLDVPEDELSGWDKDF